MSEPQRAVQPSDNMYIPMDWHIPEDFSSSYASNDFDQIKMQYDFVQADDIATFLRRYPFLLADLSKTYEIKCQYFDISPMILHYMSETGLLESATLAAYIKTDFPRNIARDIFSQFEKE